jgi:hypothetical protein
VTVIDPSGDATEAVTYRGDDHDASLKPYDWYLALVIAGAMQRVCRHPLSRACNPCLSLWTSIWVALAVLLHSTPW